MSKAPDQGPMEDGLDALRRELSLADIMKLIERTAKWADRRTFDYLPVWYPEYARRRPFYKANWSEPQTNTNRQTKISIHKTEGNRYANEALTLALGLRKKERPNWSCCHIWGSDDNRFQESNLIVQDPRYYSCIANMVLLPTPLKAFTDVMPTIKTMLRVCVRNYYNWTCEHPAAANAVKDVARWDEWTDYPASWPKSTDDALKPRGVVPFSERVREAADRRLSRIAKDSEAAGPYYPDDVPEVLKFWQVALP